MTNDAHRLAVVNARLRGKTGLFALRMEDGTIVSIEEMDRTGQTSAAEGWNVLDAEGGLALPPFVDSHLHYDSSLTAGSPRWNRSGTLFEAIACNGERQAAASREDYWERTVRTIKWQAVQGIQFVRVHADVSGPQLRSLETMLELKECMRAWVDIQIVAFPQMGLLSHPKSRELMEEAIRMGVDGVGGIPHFELTREHGVESVKLAFELAEKYGTFVDIHCDETDDDHSRFIETVAAEALSRDMGSRTTASHATAMHGYNNAFAAKLFGVMRRSGMNVVSNPLSNISLQGRFDAYPVRRGITRIKPLLEAGINVSLGHDNLHDAFYSLGTAGMLPVLHMGLHACHMLGYDDIERSLDLITVNGARTLGLPEGEYGLESGKPGNIIIMDAPEAFEVVRTQAVVRFAIRNGKLLSVTPKRYSTVIDPLEGKEETVSLVSGN